MERLTRLARHVLAAIGSNPVAALEPVPKSLTGSLCEEQRSDDDIVICSALRTPITRARRGAFRDTPCEELLAALFKATLERTRLDPKLLEDVQIGNASQPGAGGITSRMAQFLANMPVEVPIATVNRQCSSGLQTVANIATAIKAGIIDIGIGGGVESMSMYPMTEGVDLDKLSEDILDSELASSCLLAMGLTSENVAAKYGVSREVQDAMALESHRKAVAAQTQGLFQAEIVPVSVRRKDKFGGEARVLVSRDEGPRPQTTREGLARLKPAFRAGGSTTAGNSSQVSDGAAMVLLARRSAAKERGLPVLARLRSFAVVGVDPALMGIGPAFAIPVALEKAGLHTEDIDIFEVNEAFASQAVMTIERLGIPAERLNPKGGAIALGHPLGCTGSRQIATLLPELRRTGKRLGVVAMCVGTGMGAAAVFESEQQ